MSLEQILERLERVLLALERREKEAAAVAKLSAQNREATHALLAAILALLSDSAIDADQFKDRLLRLSADTLKPLLDSGQIDPEAEAFFRVYETLRAFASGIGELRKAARASAEEGVHL